MVDRITVSPEFSFARAEAQMISFVRKAERAAQKSEQSFQAANSNIGRSADTLASKLDKAFGIDRAGGSLKNFENLQRIASSTTASFDPMVAAMEKYRSELTNLNSGLAQGVISSEQHAAATLRVKAAYDAQAASIRSAAREIESQRGIQSAINRNLDVRGGGVSSNYGDRDADLQAYAQQLDQLRSKYDPLFAASKAYEQELSEINRAHSVGAITAQQQAAAVQQLNNKYQASVNETSAAIQRQADAQKQSMDQLRASFDPIFSASKKYEASLNDIATARKTGIINAQQEEAAVERLNQEYQNTTILANQGANRAAQSLKGASFATGNLAAQLNDIGVSLAAGQSPFMVMIQQGTQISQIFDQSGTSVKSFMSLLGGAAMSIINPFTLATFALIGLGGVALQYFQSIWSNSDKTKEKLKEQVSLIQRVADNWSDALPALKAYSDELQRQQSIADRASAVQTAINMRWEEARDVLPKVKDALYDVINEVLRLPQGEQKVRAMWSAFGEVEDAAKNLNEEMQSGKATIEDYDRVSAALAALQETEVVNGHNAASEAIMRMAESYFLATEAARALAAQQAAMVAGENNVAVGKGPRLKQPLTDKEFAGRFGYGDFFDMGDFDPPDPPKLGRGGSSGGRSRRSPVDQYGETVERMQQRVTALRAETAALSTLNPLQNDYGRTLAYVQTKQELLAEAKKRDVELTPDQVQAIEALASAMGDATAASAQLAEQQKKTQQTAQEFRDANQDLLKGFINDIRNGVSATEALENALGKVTDRLIDIAMNNVFDNMGGGGGGILGSIMGALGFGGGGGFKANTTLGSFLTKGYALGTANTGGSRGQVMGAVHGQEAVIPLPSGGRVPVDIKGSNNGPQRVHLIVEAQEGDMFRPVIRSESRNVSLQVTQSFNKAEKTKKRNGAPR